MAPPGVLMSRRRGSLTGGICIGVLDFDVKCTQHLCDLDQNAQRVRVLCFFKENCQVAIHTGNHKL